MRRLLTLLFLAAVAVPAAAQETPKPPRQPRPSRDTSVTRSFRYEYGPEGFVYQIGRRGRLGVVVDLSADPSRDSIGALINAVTPGSAADKAGVRTGDIVVRLNGTRLADTGGRTGEDASPGSRLVELASKLHTGDTVRLELRRDSRPVNVTVIAGSSGMEDMVRTMVRERPQMLGVPFEGGRMSFVFSGAPLANLELVKMNPGLGEYFGTSEGVLVVDAPGDSTLGLRAGDVILSIGGRKPADPSHAFRILGTYDADESVSFEVMRNKRHVTVTGKMPQQEGGWRVRHNSLDFNLPVLPDWGWQNPEGAWRGFDVPKMLRMWPHLPDLQYLRETPQQLIKVTAPHRIVET